MLLWMKRIRVLFGLKSDNTKPVSFLSFVASKYITSRPLLQGKSYISSGMNQLLLPRSLFHCSMFEVVNCHVCTSAQISHMTSLCKTLPVGFILSSSSSLPSR